VDDEVIQIVLKIEIGAPAPTGRSEEAAELQRADGRR
jgi:hypothetical protein